MLKQSHEQFIKMDGQKKKLEEKSKAEEKKAD